MNVSVSPTSVNTTLVVDSLKSIGGNEVEVSTIAAIITGLSQESFRTKPLFPGGPRIVSRLLDKDEERAIATHRIKLTIAFVKLSEKFLESRRGKTHPACPIIQKYLATRNADGSVDFNVIPTFLSQIRQYQGVGQAAERDFNAIVALAHNNIALRELLILHNTRLVVSVAKQIRSSFPLVDRIGAGMIGLTRAAEKFNPEVGCRFSTYATWWIRQSIRKEGDSKGSIIHLPQYIIETRRTVEKALRKVPQQQRSSSDIATLSGRPLTHVQTYFATSQSKVLLYGDVEPTIEDTSFDDSKEARFDAADIALAVKSGAAPLDAKERRVLTLRFGLDSESAGGQTYAAVGKIMRFTRARAQQLGHSGLSKLKEWLTRGDLEGRVVEGNTAK
jgi:RNA polymerase nonessential primary-like sigma factor